METQHTQIIPQAGQLPPYRDIELALASVESAINWIENQPVWTKHRVLRPIWRKLHSAQADLRTAYFTTIRTTSKD